MVVISIEQVSPDCEKIITSAGPSFFIRLSYLKLVDPAAVCSSAEFEGDQESDILDAGLAYSAERKAVSYLARAEQCRAGLLRKLIVKGYKKEYVERALDYLEQRSFLSDARFARAWLNARKISRSEGRTRLAAELAARGIDRETATTALDEFFESNSEDALCRRALEKCRRLGKNDQKTCAYLISCGFPFRMIEREMEMGDPCGAGFLS